MKNLLNNLWIAIKSRWLLGVILLSYTASVWGSEQPMPRPGFSYEDFSILMERNPFNPNRRIRVAPPEPVATPTPRPAPDEITLIGTLVLDDRSYAFFDGNKSEFNSIQTEGGVIADCTVAAITAQGVKLQTKQGEMELRVGTGIRRQGESEWSITEEGTSTVRSERRPESRSDNRTESRTDNRSPRSGSSAPAADRSSPAASPGPASEGSGGADDILSRLRQRRSQEAR